MELLKLILWSGTLGATLFVTGILLHRWRERRYLSVWPYQKTAPPQRIFLGRDEERPGHITVTWWVWRMNGADVEYLRKDIVDARLAVLRAEIKSLRAAG